MTYTVKIRNDGRGDVVVEIADGPLAGEYIDESAIMRCDTFDEYAYGVIENARACISRAQRAIARMELLIGNVKLPSRDEYMAAHAMAEREYRERPLRDAEAALAKLVTVGSDPAKISYARIDVAVQRGLLIERDAHAQYDGDREIPKFDATSDEYWIDTQEERHGVPVRIELSHASAHPDGIVVRYEIIDPMPLSLPPQKVDDFVLEQICRATGVMEIGNLEDLMFRSFVALMDDDANITRFYYPDLENVPEVPVLERKPTRPWGTVIGRLAERAAA